MNILIHITSPFFNVRNNFELFLLTGLYWRSSIIIMPHFKVYYPKVSTETAIIKVAGQTFIPYHSVETTIEELREEVVVCKSDISTLKHFNRLKNTPVRTDDEEEQYQQLLAGFSYRSVNVDDCHLTIKECEVLINLIDNTPNCNSVICSYFKSCLDLTPISNIDSIGTGLIFGDDESVYEKLVHLSTRHAEEEDVELVKTGKTPRLTYVEIDNKDGFDITSKLPKTVKTVEVNYIGTDPCELSFDGEVIVNHTPIIKCDKPLNVVDFNYSTDKSFKQKFSLVDYSTVKKVTIPTSSIHLFKHFDELELMSNLEEVEFLGDICHFPDNFVLKTVTKVVISVDRFGKSEKRWERVDERLANLNKVFPNVSEIEGSLVDLQIPNWCTKLNYFRKVLQVTEATKQVHIRSIEPLHFRDYETYNNVFIIPTNPNYEVTASILFDDIYSGEVPECLLPQVHFA